MRDRVRQSFFFSNSSTRADIPTMEGWERRSIGSTVCRVCNQQKVLKRSNRTAGIGNGRDGSSAGAGQWLPAVGDRDQPQRQQQQPTADKQQTNSRQARHSVAEAGPPAGGDKCVWLVRCHSPPARQACLGAKIAGSCQQILRPPKTVPVRRRLLRPHYSAVIAMDPSLPSRCRSCH